VKTADWSLDTGETPNVSGLVYKKTVNAARCLTARHNSLQHKAIPHENHQLRRIESMTTVETASKLRFENGCFAPGNGLARGNPHARRMHEVR
jgi:hypothetical protein